MHNDRFLLNHHYRISYYQFNYPLYISPNFGNEFYLKL